LTRKWLLLVDFDGTVTDRDADFVIADAALGPQGAALYAPLVESYERLEIGTREYFERLLDLLRIAPDQLVRCAKAVALRPGFDLLVRWCREAGVALRIVSEGLDLYIEPILRRHGLGHLELSCNRAQFDGRRYRILPPPQAEPCARCLNCKGEHVRRAQSAGLAVALIGNGASDLCAARLADLVLARDGLIDRCREQGIPHVTWRDFEEALAALERHVGRHIHPR